MHLQLGEKNEKSIWQVDVNGISHYSTVNIQHEAVKFFSSLYKAREDIDVADLLWYLEDYPKMFEEGDLLRLNRRFGTEEVIGVLK